MGQRFTITEEERNNILNLYEKVLFEDAQVANKYELKVGGKSYGSMRVATGRDIRSRVPKYTLFINDTAVESFHPNESRLLDNKKIINLLGKLDVNEYRELINLITANIHKVSPKVSVKPIP